MADLGKEIEIIINNDGSVEIDQIGYQGKQCQNDIEDLINAIGIEKSKSRKREYYQKQKEKVNIKNK